MPERFHVINDLIQKYNLKNPAYLEIGVWYGDTFKHVNTMIKDGVDPGQYCDCELVNYKMTSDEFFKDHINKKYDIIFIDGLHTAYQVSKDIYNSLNNLNDGGFIVLDDVYPHNENEQESLDLTKVGAQTGDVWKAVYNILDDMIEMSDEVMFIEDVVRGNMVFKIKRGNTSNITIDPTIPTVNTDGWYKGEDKEWNKYSYTRDFLPYFIKISNYLHTVNV